MELKFIFSLRCWFLCTTTLPVTLPMLKTSMKFWGTSFELWLRPCLVYFLYIFYALCTICVFYVPLLLNIVKITFSIWYDMKLSFIYQKTFKKHIKHLYNKKLLFEFKCVQMLLNSKIWWNGPWNLSYAGVIKWK